MIITLQPYYAGQVNQGITRWKLICTDTLAEVTANAFLNSGNLMGYTVSPTDIFDCFYAYTGAIDHPGIGTYVELLPTISFSNGLAVITLNQVVNSGNVPLPTLPVVSGNIVEFNGVNGAIADSNISAANVMTKNSVNTMAAGSNIILDKGTGTEVSNAVTISHQSGVITSVSLTTAAQATHIITLTNTFIATSSVVLTSLMGGTNTTPGVQLSATALAGSSVITITNTHATAAFNGTLFIGFTVF